MGEEGEPRRDCLKRTPHDATVSIRDAALSEKTPIEKMASHMGEEGEARRDCLKQTRHDAMVSIRDAS